MSNKEQGDQQQTEPKMILFGGWFLALFVKGSGKYIATAPAIVGGYK